MDQVVSLKGVAGSNYRRYVYRACTQQRALSPIQADLNGDGDVANRNLGSRWLHSCSLKPLFPKLWEVIANRRKVPLFRPQNLCENWKSNISQFEQVVC